MKKNGTQHGTRQGSSDSSLLIAGPIFRFGMVSMVRQSGDSWWKEPPYNGYDNQCDYEPKETIFDWSLCSSNRMKALILITNQRETFSEIAKRQMKQLQQTVNMQKWMVMIKVRDLLTRNFDWFETFRRTAQSVDSWWKYIWTSRYLQKEIWRMGRIHDWWKINWKRRYDSFLWLISMIHRLLLIFLWLI